MRNSFWRMISTAFQAGWELPIHAAEWILRLWKFGFSSQKHSRIQKYPSRSKFSIHHLIFAWRAITFITAGHRPADKDITTIAAWKAELLQLHRQISMPAKSENPTSCFCAFVANKSTAFQAGWELPIHAAEWILRLWKFGFSSRETSWNTEIFIAVEAFNSPANFCLKGNTLHNRRSRPADKDVPIIAVWKAELLQLHRWISMPAKSENPTSRLCAFVANKSTAFQAGWQLPIHPAE